jgi:cytochrome c-type biogenesis protein CcmH/NrfF
MLWLIPITILVVGTAIIVRAARRRGQAETALTTDPVSGQWLAEIRGRDDRYW